MSNDKRSLVRDNPGDSFMKKIELTENKKTLSSLFFCRSFLRCGFVVAVLLPALTLVPLADARADDVLQRVFAVGDGRLFLQSALISVPSNLHSNTLPALPRHAALVALFPDVAAPLATTLVTTQLTPVTIKDAFEMGAPTSGSTLVADIAQPSGGATHAVSSAPVSPSADPVAAPAMTTAATPVVPTAVIPLPQSVPALNMGASDGEQPFPLPMSPPNADPMISHPAVSSPAPLADKADGMSSTENRVSLGTTTGLSVVKSSADVPPLPGVVAPDSAAPTTPPVITGAVTPAPPVPPPAWVVEHDKAVELARAGHNDRAATLLRKLHREHPEDLGIARDYIFTLQWSDHHEAAIQNFKRLPKGDEPDFVLEAVAHAYRDIHEPAAALALYRRGLKQSPQNVTFAAGEIRCLNELYRYPEALKRAEADLQAHGDRLDVLLPAAEAAEQTKNDYQALGYYEKALQFDHENHEGLHGFIMLLSRMGAGPLAHRLADQHPYVITDVEYRHIQGDEAATYVRWGPLEPVTEDQRFAATDRAIELLDKLIDDWRLMGSPADSNVLRARFDRIVALRDRSRMQDVVDEYGNLVQNDVTIPNYTLAAVGDAYLYLRQPEVARDIYLKILETDPKNFDVRRQLFFAYVECDDFNLAYATIDQLQTDQPIWIWLKGQTEPLPNPDRAAVDLDVGNARLFGDELQDSYDRIKPVVNAAPNEARNQAVMGNIEAARGWPRQALGSYKIGLALQQIGDVGDPTGIATTNLELQHFPLANEEADDLMKRFPEDLDVQRTERLWQVHNMAELDLNANYAFRPTTSEAGGEGFGLETKIYSAPIDYNWRIFAGEFFAHETEPFGEGNVSFSRSTAGVNYRNGNVTAEAAPTFNHYNGTERLGGAADVDYAFSDQWKAGAAAELFSRETPLRALNAGTTADLFSANMEWRQSESRSLTATATYMPFSDDNERTSVNGTYTERLYTEPYFTIDGYVDMGESHDTKDNDRPYFNPAQDASGGVGILATQPLYRREEMIWEHSLKLGPGVYWEKGYGVSDAGSLTYEQRLHYSDTLEGTADVTVAHQSYDGSSENDVGVTLNLVKRF